VVFLARIFAADAAPETLIRDGHYKRALAMVEPRLRANPGDPETLSLMSRLKQEWRDFKTAQDLAEKAVAADPKNARYHLRLAEVVGDQIDSAGPLRQMGMAKHFKKEIDATIALDPRNIEALKHLVEYYFGAPGILGGDKAKGQATVEQIMPLDPAEGYLAQAMQARLEKQPGTQEALFRKAVEANPSNYDAQISMGNYCAFAGKKPAEGEAHAREAIKLEPGRIAGYTVLAGALAIQDQWSALDAALAASEQNVPDNLQPFFRSANVCLGKGIELLRAERYLRKYLSQEPEPNAQSHGRAHWRLGLVLEKEGRKSDAIAELQSAVKMEPGLAGAKEDLKRLK
jgi:tetratricopeptide (TPR) repeat protein